MKLRRLIRRALAALGLVELPWWEREEEPIPQEPKVPTVSGEPLRAVLARRNFGRAGA